MINWSLTNAIQILALEFLATQGQVLLENKRFKRPVLEAWVRTQPDNPETNHSYRLFNGLTD